MKFKTIVQLCGILAFLLGCEKNNKPNVSENQNQPVPNQAVEQPIVDEGLLPKLEFTTNIRNSSLIFNIKVEEISLSVGKDLFESRPYANAPLQSSDGYYLEMTYLMTNPYDLAYEIDLSRFQALYFPDDYQVKKRNSNAYSVKSYFVDEIFLVTPNRDLSFNDPRQYRTIDCLRKTGGNNLVTFQPNESKTFKYRFKAVPTNSGNVFLRSFTATNAGNVNHTDVVLEIDLASCEVLKRLEEKL